VSISDLLKPFPPPSPLLLLSLLPMFEDVDVGMELVEDSFGDRDEVISGSERAMQCHNA
jgi:hypothetical protein